MNEIRQRLWGLCACSMLGLMLASQAFGQTASVSVEKLDAPDPVVAGTNLTYTITLSNEGPSAASNTSVADTLPAGTSFVSLAAPPGWTCLTPAVGAGGTVTCSNASMAVGSEMFTLVVSVASAVANGSTISNTATVSSSTTDPDPNDNSATASSSVETQADLSVTKEGSPNPVLPAAALTYTITVANAGPSDAANVLLGDVLPSSTTFSGLSAPGGWTCTTPAVGASGTISCGLAAMAPGTAVFTLVVGVGGGVPGGTVITNTAAVASDTADPNSSNNSATATNSVAAPSSLSASKAVEGAFVPGGTVTYTILLANAGPAAQADNPGDEFIDILPASLSLVGATSSSGTPSTNVPGNSVAWNGSIGAGGSVTITIVATISPSAYHTQYISNQGQVSFDADGNGSNESTVQTDNPLLPGAQDATGFAVAASVPAVPSMGRWEWFTLNLLVLLLGTWAAARRNRGGLRG